MKYQSFIYLSLMLSLIACEKDKMPKQTTCFLSPEYSYFDEVNNIEDSICTTDICTEYLAIWQELFQEKNNLSQAFIDNHIELYGTKVQSWKRGVSFRVLYRIKIGWAISNNNDHFIIKIDSAYSWYPSLNLPRNKYLTKEEIKIAIENKAFSSDMIKLNNSEDLKFQTFDMALNSLIEYSKVSALCLNEIKVNEDNGNLTLIASAKYENEDNLCIVSRIDLITGEREVINTSCVDY